MKKNLILALLALFFTLGTGKMTVSAQSGVLQQRISVSVEGGTLDDAVVQIEKQTSLMFLYKTQDIAPSHRVTLHARREPLSVVLDRLVEGTKLGWELSDNHIVLTQKSVDDQPRRVTGHVLDKNGVPIIGATVIVKGTTVGTSTGADGSFALEIPAPAAKAVLSFGYLGYDDTEIPVGSRTAMEVTLRESALEMDAVVVTALGIKRSEKALSYNVQQVSAEEIVGNKDVNFVNALSGKVAGVNINASSSGVGGASKVVMRGTKGIDQSSNALYVIDGIPMYNLGGEGGTEFDSAGTSEAVADINPEDIESVSVLTGAAAAALYGSYASNGAIVITTKKGKAGHTSVTVTSNTEVHSPFVMPEFQNRYGTGNLNASEGQTLMSWGRRLGAADRTGYSPRSDYFQTGVTGTETVSLSTGTDRNQTYLSASAVNSRGIVPNNGYERYNFTARNTTSLLKDRMTLDIGASYIMQNDRNMVNQGTYANPLVSAYLFPAETTGTVCGCSNDTTPNAASGCRTGTSGSVRAI